MAASGTRVLHFGFDNCYRVRVLQSAGYEVTESRSFAKLGFDLKRDTQIDAVIVSEDDPKSAEQAADFVRQHRFAPVIVFRRGQAALDETKFDRVYQTSIPPKIWLTDMATLIKQSRSIQGQSARLGQDVGALLEQTSRESARSHQERERNKNGRDLWGSGQGE